MESESVEEKKPLAWDLDEVLTDLKFGSYQVRSLCLIGLVIMFSNVYPLSFTLTAGDLDYRCYVPECEKSRTATEYTPSWLPSAVPYFESQPRKCLKYESHSHHRRHNDSSYNTSECSISSFDTNKEVNCDEWVFATEERTIVQDFDVKCENNKWKLTLVGTINNVGQFFGIFLFGVVSDRLGRKFVIVWCCVMSALFGILRGLSNSYILFLIFEFLDSFFGSAIYGAAFIWGVEMVNPNMRPLASTIIGIFYPIGAVIMGCVAWYFQDWQKMLIVCYTPGLLIVLYYWFIPESVRWLQMNGRYDEVFKILKSISKSNRVPLPETALEMRKETHKEVANIKDDEDISFWKNFTTAIQSRRIFFRLLNCSFSWFGTTLVYYGLSINSVELAGNKFFNFILTNGVEVPAFILSGFICNKIERRVSQSAAFFLSGLACILCEFVPSDIPGLQISIYLFSKFLITISFNILYIYSAEMFPTELRLSLCGFASMFGRIGSMIAPQTVLLRDVVGEHAPVLLFGVISLIAGGLATFYPETLNKKLPDTLNQSKLDDERAKQKQ